MPLIEEIHSIRFFVSRWNNGTPFLMYTGYHSGSLSVKKSDLSAAPPHAAL